MKYFTYEELTKSVT